MRKRWCRCDVDELNFKPMSIDFFVSTDFVLDSLETCFDWILNSPDEEDGEHRVVWTIKTGLIEDNLTEASWNLRITHGKVCGI